MAACTFFTALEPADVSSPRSDAISTAAKPTLLLPIPPARASESALSTFGRIRAASAALRRMPCFPNASAICAAVGAAGAWATIGRGDSEQR